MKKSDRSVLGHCVRAFGSLLLLAAHPAFAQLVVPKCEITVQQGGRFDNASHSDADLSATDADGRLILGRNVVFADATSVSGAFVSLGNGASVFDVNVDELRAGRKAVVRGVQGPFDASNSTCALPAVQCGGQNVSLRRGSAPQTLSPGIYNRLDLENGTSLTLNPGVYTFCEIKLGRHVSVRVVGATQSTINVGGDVRLGNDTSLVPDGSTPTPLLNGAGDIVRVGAQGALRAFVTAPNAKLSIGRNATFTGSACAQRLAISKKVTVACAPDVVATTTTTSAPTTTTTTSSTSSTTSTSTTSTTTTSQPTCGNGVLDPGEECDGSAFGGFTCPSPSGALLCTGDCKIDFSECPEASTTTTSTTVATTSTSTTTSAPASTTTTSTTTSSTSSTTPTSTTTTTTSQPTCGNGVIDPGEQCDGSAFGGFTCPSPGGALLCTGDCKIDFSECPSASSTSTTAAPTTTTSTTAAPTTTSTTGAPPTTLEPTTTTSTTLEPTTTTSTTLEPTTTTSTSTTSTTEEPTTTTSTTTTTTQPLPTLLDFTLGAPGGNCGETRDGSDVLVKTLTCGGLNLGGGGSIIPEGPTPDGSVSRFSLSCTGSSCNIGPTSTTPAANSASPDCTNTGCNFGTPLPIANPLAGGSLTVCVLNTWSAPASGTLDLTTGTSSTNVPLTSDTYITGNLAQPCPVCRNGGAVASGSPSSPATGLCDRGPNAGGACTTTSSTGITRDCLTGGSDATHPCTPGGGNCIDGSHVGPIAVSLSPLTTGSASKSDANGLFCPNQGPAAGPGHLAGCFGSPTCRSITENGSPGGPISIGVPASAKLASVFCVASTGNGLVDASTDLPGPGAVSLPGNFVAN